MTTLTAHIILLAAGLIDFIATLHNDVRSLQLSGYSNRRYNEMMKKNEEITSFNRLLTLAVLIGVCTTMAQMSWMVVLILAIPILAHGLYSLFHNLGKPPKLSTRSWIVLVIALLLGAGAAALTTYFMVRHAQVEGARVAAIAMLVELLVSPLFVMLANCFFPRAKED
jgi:hypothetical protein